MTFLALRRHAIHVSVWIGFFIKTIQGKKVATLFTWLFPRAVFFHKKSVFSASSMQNRRCTFCGVQANMFCFSHKHEVFKAVISFLVIKMMDYFCRKKLSANSFSHYMSMLRNVLPVYQNQNITRSVDSFSNGHIRKSFRTSWRTILNATLSSARYISKELFFAGKTCVSASHNVSLSTYSTI